MAAAGPSRPPGDFSNKPSGPRGRYAQNNKKYGTPIPILLPSSPLHPAYQPPSKLEQQSFLSSLTSSLRGSQAIIPQVTGVYDAATQSVIVRDRKDMELLFQRGFFGKGTLSRSEPTWRDRRVDMVRGGDAVAAEKIREKRRLERKQFKIDRAAAMLEAAVAAETVITTGQAPSTLAGTSTPDASAAGVEVDEGVEEGGDAGTATASPATTTAETIIDVNTLTPQTFLVRPTRPDANRNRGKNAFKRKPKPKPVAPAQAGVNTADSTATATDESTTTPAAINAIDPSAPAPAAAGPSSSAAIASTSLSESAAGHDEEEEEEDFDASVVEEMEHLQLGLEEAWFLSAALGVLRIHDPATNSLIPNHLVLPHFITPPSLSDSLTPLPSSRLLPDDPFLVSYVAYHHFRSLGWAVKPGIKFSCDWLLYRRGPVFSHAAFACVVIPVYMDAQDRETSPYGQEDWYEERLSWKWMNTIMRVNSLVQKTVILVYVTIPAASSIDKAFKLEDGSLHTGKNDMRTLLQRYTTREVCLQRFGPARRRD